MAWQGGFKGDSYDRPQWRAYLRTQKKPTSGFLVIHATGAPYTLAAVGGAKRMANLANYYKNQQKWKGGPNAFVMGDGRIYPGTPVSLMGVHSPGFNNISTAFEAEGDYRKGQRPWASGDGKAVWDAMAWASAEWLEWMGMDADDKHCRFHMEDARTTHKACPGAMQKAWFVAKVREAMNPILAKAPPPPPPVMPIVTAKAKQFVYAPGKFAWSNEWLVPMMKKIEGLRLKAYPDPPGWSIGYGHCSTSKVAPITYEGMTLPNEAAADALLRADLNALCLHFLNAWVKVPLEQGMIDALCMFVFQQGATQFKRKLVPTINQKMHWTVAKMIETMPHAKAGVMRRRRLEAARYRGESPTKW